VQCVAPYTYSGIALRVDPKPPPIAEFATEFFVRQKFAEKSSASRIRLQILSAENPPKKDTDIRIIKKNQHSKK